MATAQMTQTVPRLVTDIQPPAQAKPAAPSSMQAEVVHNIEIRDPNAQTPHGFSAIMSAEHHDSHKAPSDSLLNDASKAVHSQSTPEAGQKAKSAAGPKPILESVLLLIGCGIACAVVAVIFSAS